MIDEYLDALVAIGNHKEVVKVCEPDVMQSLKLENWMVKRTLYALGLMEREYEKLRTTDKAGTGTLPKKE